MSKSLACGLVLDGLLMIYNNRQPTTSPICCTNNKISQKPWNSTFGEVGDKKLCGRGVLVSRFGNYCTMIIFDSKVLNMICGTCNFDIIKSHPENFVWDFLIAFLDMKMMLSDKIKLIFGFLVKFCVDMGILIFFQWSQVRPLIAAIWDIPLRLARNNGGFF